MIVTRIVPVMLFIFLISAAVQAGEHPSLEGDYKQLVNHQFQFDGRKVEIIEFLSFYCGHCYYFEKSIPVIKGNFPKKIDWKVVPIYWGKGSPNPGRAYLLAEEAGKGEEMKKALFEALFVEKQDIGKIDVLEDIGTKLGLGFDFSRRLRAGEKSGEVGEAILKANAYNIDETPTLVIAGNLKTSAGMFQGNIDLLRENTITILKSLFKK